MGPGPLSVPAYTRRCQCIGGGAEGVGGVGWGWGEGGKRGFLTSILDYPSARVVGSTCVCLFSPVLFTH